MLAKAFWEDRSGNPAVKYAPGDEIPDDHPKRDWLLRSKIAAVVEEPAEAVDVADDQDDAVDVVDDDQAVDNTPADDVEEPVKADTAKPKPTDSVDAHRNYLKARKIDTKGLTRQQMIKIIAGLED